MKEVPHDLKCSVCFDLLSHPVRLPCSHVFCRDCIQRTFDFSQVACPNCRERFGSWLRKKKKFEVDEELWQLIKQKYPENDRNQLNGIGIDTFTAEDIEVVRALHEIVEDSDFVEDWRGWSCDLITVCRDALALLSTDHPITVLRSPEKRSPIIPLAKPGEIREEYEKMRQKEEEIEKQRKEEELRKSEQFLRTIEEEDRMELERLQREKEEELKRDAELAKQLAAEEEEVRMELERLQREKEEQLKLDAELAKKLAAEEEAKAAESKQRGLAHTPERSKTCEKSKISTFFDKMPPTDALSTSDATDSSPFKTSADFDDFTTGDGVAYQGPASPPIDWRDIPSTSRCHLFKCKEEKESSGESTFSPRFSSTPEPNCKKFISRDRCSAGEPGPDDPLPSAAAEQLRSTQISNHELSNFSVVSPRISSTSTDDKAAPVSRCSSGADSISPELHHFKPIRVSPTTPPKAGGSKCLPQIVTAHRGGEGLEPNAASCEVILAVCNNPDVTMTPEEIEMAFNIERQMAADYEVARTIQRQLKREEKKRTIPKTYNLRKKRKSLRKSVLVDRAQLTLDNMFIK